MTTENENKLQFSAAHKKSHSETVTSLRAAPGAIKGNGDSLCL